MTCRLERIGELVLLLVVALAAAVLAGIALARDAAGEAAAWSAILMAIINAVKERWSNQSVSRMGDQLAASQPRTGDAQEVRVVNDATAPVPVEETK